MCKDSICECADFYAYRAVFRRTQWYALFITEGMYCAYSTSKILKEPFLGSSCLEIEGELFYVPERTSSYNSFVLKREVIDVAEIPIGFWWHDLLERYQNDV